MAAAAALIAAGGLSVATATQASAATPGCGPFCIDLYSQSAGSGSLLDAFNQPSASGVVTGQPAILDAAQNTNPGEDFVASDQGAASDFFAAGLISAVLDQHYPSDQGDEFEYAPNGVETGECLGVPVTPTAGTLVDLQQCGVTAKTVWFIDTSTSPAGFFTLINGGDVDFPPFVLTAQPGTQQLEVAQLQTSGGLAEPAQQWNASHGQVGTSTPASTSTTVASSGDPSVAGQTVTYTATVSPAPDGGTVAFSDTGNPVSGCTAQPVSVGTGQATCQVTYPSPGSHAITAGYSGGSAFLASSSGPLTQVVNPAPPVCTTTITGTHATRLAVTSGITCLVNATQNGQVTVSSGASLAVTNSTVNGSVTATGAASISYCGSTQSGSLSFSGTAGAVTLGGTLPSGTACAADTIPSSITISGTTGPVVVSGVTENGTLTLSGNTGGVTVNGVRLSGSASVQNNTGSAAVVVSGNTVNGSLSCTGNTPAPVDNGTVNTVSGKASGQCAAIAVR